MYIYKKPVEAITQEAHSSSSSSSSPSSLKVYQPSSTIRKHQLLSIKTNPFHSSFYFISLNWAHFFISCMHVLLGYLLLHFSKTSTYNITQQRNTYFFISRPGNNFNGHTTWGSFQFSSSFFIHFFTSCRYTICLF